MRAPPASVDRIMDPKTSNALTDMIATLTRAIESLEEIGFSESASILRIGRLDLQMRLNEISEDELRALCEQLERQKKDSQ